MSPETNQAVALYRKLKLREWDTEIQEEELRQRLLQLPLEEFKDYAFSTMEIDAAMNKVQHEIDQAEWAYSTQKQLMHQAANRAGLDNRKGVS